jgi:hypothetical protein
VVTDNDHDEELHEGDAKVKILRRRTKRLGTRKMMWERVKVQRMRRK